jgi:hypothetical protein
MAEYRVGDTLHGRLRGYKDAPEAGVRERHRDALTRDLASWLSDGTPVGCLGHWSVVAPVPSTRRPGAPPAGALLDGVPALGGHRLDLLGRGRRAADHLDARRDGFALLPGIDRAGLAGLPVLLFDDSVTTGARSQSAAAALRLAGARVVGVLAVGRALPPPRRGRCAPPAG